MEKIISPESFLVLGRQNFTARIEDDVCTARNLITNLQLCGQDRTIKVELMLVHKLINAVQICKIILRLRCLSYLTIKVNLLRFSQINKCSTDL